MHHETELSEITRKMFATLGTDPDIYDAQFGPTGRFPEGKLTPNDEGEIVFGITHYKCKVVINFGTPIASLGMSATQARAVARALMRHAHAALVVGAGPMSAKDDHFTTK